MRVLDVGYIYDVYVDSFIYNEERDGYKVIDWVKIQDNGVVAIYTKQKKERKKCIR